MKCIILTVACFAVVAKSNPQFGLEGLGRLAGLGSGVGSEVGSAIGRGVGTGVGLAADVGAGALGLGAGIIGAGAEALGEGANLAGNALRGVADAGLGLLGLGGGRRAAASNYNQGANSGASQYDTGASGAQNQGYRNRGEQESHNRGHRHNAVSKVEQAESSEDHDIGGGRVYDEGAQGGSGFNKYARGAKRFGNNYDNAAQEIESGL